MVISIENIHKSFGKLHILKGINLAFSEGMIYSVLGPNGSGKTTLMKSILGLVRPNDGSIVVMGNNALQHNQYRKDIGYVPQIARFPENLKVHEVIELVRQVRKQDANPDTYIKLFEIEGFLNARLKNLSGGTRQKVNLVLALMFESDILILDEPTTGLDPINNLRLKELLVQKKNQGKTIILTTHILHLAEEISDEIVFLLEGQIKYRGSVERLLTLTEKDTLEKSIAALLENGNNIKLDNETKSVNNKTHTNHA